MARKKSDKSLPSLPKGEFQFTFGSNYGLDGFDFRDDYNEGVLDAARLPETKGLSALPDGFFREGEADAQIEHSEGPDISHVLREAATQVPDLDWLELDEGYVGDLPEDPTDGMLDEIVEAWGHGMNTTGVRISPQRIDRSLLRDYVEEVEETTMSPEYLREKLRAASRDSARGVPLKTIYETFTGDSLSKEDRVLLRRGLDQIKSEHGLVGRVFIRASAYPRCESRKWSKHVARNHRQARWLIASAKCGDCVHNEDSYCQILRKELVTEVPWKKALGHFSPRLRAAGVKPREGEDPKKTLLRGFAKMGQYVEDRETSYHIERDQTEGISVQKASSDLRRAKSERERVLSADGTKERRVRRALTKIAAWHKEQLLNKRDAKSLLMLARNDPRAALAKAARFIWKAGQGVDEYQGEGRGAALARESANVQSQTPTQEDIDGAVRAELSNKVGSLVSARLLTKKEARKLLGLGYSSKKTLRIASELVARKELSGTDMPAKAAHESARPYRGEGSKAIPNFEEGLSLSAAEQELVRARQQVKIHPREIQAALRWAAQKMSEGFIGEELTELLNTKFSSLLLRTARREIKGLRVRQEGLAGQLYVDASAYASEEGYEGCEKGAFKHRGNALRYVMGMKRCKGCTLNSAGYCQKYDKEVVFEPPVSDPVEYQREAIRLANASDAEQTANLFAPTGAEVIDKFGGLANSPINNFSLDAEPEPDDLGGFLWDGIHIDEDYE